MSPAISEPLATIIAVYCCALSVKMLDDFLDRELDARAGRSNWARQLADGTPVYAILLLALAACLNAPVSLTLFFASYSIGMFHDLWQTFPSKLTGWQESLLVLGLGAIFFPWQQMLFSLLFVLAVQLTDDCLDYHLDRMAGQRNLAHRLGIVESLLLTGIALLSACWISSELFVQTLCGAGLFYLSQFYKEVLKC